MEKEPFVTSPAAYPTAHALLRGFTNRRPTVDAIAAMVPIDEAFSQGTCVVTFPALFSQPYPQRVLISWGVSPLTAEVVAPRCSRRAPLLPIHILRGAFSPLI